MFRVESLELWRTISQREESPRITSNRTELAVDPRKIEKMARKNREKSQQRYEEETKKPAIGATDKRKKELEEKAPDPRYEGADRLFNEMKKKDRS